jgi:hypothetical protein
MHIRTTWRRSVSEPGTQIVVRLVSGLGSAGAAESDNIVNGAYMDSLLRSYRAPGGVARNNA